MADHAALIDVTLEFAAGRRSPCSGRTAPARRPCCACSRRCSRPEPGNSSCSARSSRRVRTRSVGKSASSAHEPLLYRELSAARTSSTTAGLYGVDGRAGEELLDAAVWARRAARRCASSRGAPSQRVGDRASRAASPALLLLDEAFSHLTRRPIELVQPLIGRGAEATRVLTSHDAMAIGYTMAVGARLLAKSADGSHSAGCHRRACWCGHLMFGQDWNSNSE